MWNKISPWIIGAALLILVVIAASAASTNTTNVVDSYHKSKSTDTIHPYFIYEAELEKAGEIMRKSIGIMVEASYAYGYTDGYTEGLKDGLAVCLQTSMEEEGKR